MRPLILVSTSPHRRALLERLRLPFRCRRPACDEERLKDPAWSPRERAERLARAKAESLAQAEPRATLIGCDQVVALKGRILEKPGAPLGAVTQLTALAGQTHELITALAVWQAGQVRTCIETARLRMRRLSPAEVARYVAADAPYDCAGSYKLESLGIALFDEIQAADHTAITGLPLLALARILREFGYFVP